MKKVNGIPPMKLKCGECGKVSEIKVEFDGMYVVAKFSDCKHTILVRSARWKKH